MLWPTSYEHVKEQFLLIKFYAMGYLVDCIFFSVLRMMLFYLIFLLLMESLRHSLEYILIVLY